MDDDWDKPRKPGQRFSADDIECLRKSFLRGTSARRAAREIQCSSDTAEKYYKQFREEKFDKGIDPAYSRGVKLSANKVAELRQAFNRGESAVKVSRRIGISRNCAAHWYHVFSCGGHHPVEMTAKPPRSPRHYVGNFELTEDERNASRR